MDTEKLEDLLEDLNFLIKHKEFNLEDISTFVQNVKTDTFKRYLQMLPLSKPETATEVIFTEIFRALKLNLIPQTSLKGGWIDYTFSEAGKNPVGFEIKPLFVRKRNKFKLNEINHKEEKILNQVKKYLRDVEYVVLTNGVKAFFFNREALVSDEPFKEIPFSELVKRIKEQKSVWDTLRRLEDEVPKKDLDEQFFKDLKKWYSELGKVEWKENSYDTEELKILILNKFIFAQTLEDFALIPFKFIESKYNSAENEWLPKGYKKVVKEFLSSIDSWFYEYYDTELFKTDVFKHLVDSEDNYRNFFRTLGRILGFGTWERTFGLGLTFYNYRQIDEDIFGKAYETFLAEHRKEQGIYYTPKLITEYMAKKLVNELFSEEFEELKKLLTETLLDGENFERAKNLANSIRSKKIVDPASGSGSFLIKVFREIAKLYGEIAEIIGELTKPKNGLFHDKLNRGRAQRVEEIGKILGVYKRNFREILEIIAIRHIYAVDIDPKALDIAKVNLWKKAIKIKPSEFRFWNLGDTTYILPSLEINFVSGDALYPNRIRFFVEELSKNYKSEVKELINLRREYENNPQNREVIDEFIRIKEKVKNELIEKYNLNLSEPVIYPLEFPHAFFDENGKPLPSGGFDGVIGNPPWENIKPNKKEFASKFPHIFEEVSKFSIEGKKFEKLFKEKLNENPELKGEWEKYKNHIKELSKYYRKEFPLHGSSGDLSYQKLFLELSLNLSKKAIALLVPSNFHTDEGTKELREFIFKNYNLKELLSFENRSKVWFKDVDSRFKFDIVLITKEKPQKNFKARFYIRKWEEINEAFDYPVEVIEKLSPHNRGIIEFRKKEDLGLSLKIRDDYPLLKDYGVWITTELHMTNDNELFQENRCPSCIPLYQGGMIHQYNPYFSPPNYYVEENITREKFLEREIKRFLKGIPKEEKQKWQGKLQKAFNCISLDYQLPRLVYRAIARSTDERTLISCVLTETAFLGNSLNYIKRIYPTLKGNDLFVKLLSEDIVYYLQALFNSFVLDYYIRLKVSANLNTFFVYELPIPYPELKIWETLRVSDCSDSTKREGKEEETSEGFEGLKIPPQVDSKISKRIVELSKELSRKGGKDLNVRTELELFIAREVFKLTKDEFSYILSTFTHGRNSDYWQNLGKEILKIY